RRIIAIDCEMVELAYGRETVIHLSAVDFLSGEVQIDQIVAPPVMERVTDYRTGFTGETSESIASAIGKRKCILSLVSARAALASFMDSDTILVGFSVHHDLEALRFSHLNIVDFQLLYSTAFHGKTIGLRKAFEAYFPNDKIQNHGPSAKSHVCLEDVMAARELVLFWIEKKGQVEILSAAEARERYEEERLAEEQAWEDAENNCFPTDDDPPGYGWMG
ncbi:hypothetical protein BJ508DRAFT_343264, partial [Ascobolus immersus RN42]